MLCNIFAQFWSNFFFYNYKISQVKNSHHQFLPAFFLLSLISHTNALEQKAKILRGGEERGPRRLAHNAQLTWAGRSVVIKPKSFASAMTAITHGRLSEIWPPFKLLCLEIHPVLSLVRSLRQCFSPGLRVILTLPLLSPPYSDRSAGNPQPRIIRGDVSQSGRFRNAVVIYCACREPHAWKPRSAWFPRPRALVILFGRAISPPGPPRIRSVF